MIRTSHAAALAAVGVEDGPAAEALSTYLDVLARWSGRVNLTAARSVEERIATLIAPVASMAPTLVPGGLLDIGSGNGSPGLILALLRPDLPAILLEPRTKRWAFLREAARACGRGDVDIRPVRHDGYDGPAATNVTIRALALPFAAIEPLVAPGGQLLVWGKAPGGVPLRLKHYGEAAIGGFRIHRFG